jgi:hypothetical protein
MSKDTGGPAFPCEIKTGAVATDANGINRYVTEPYEGMTLRDYFAAKAMQGYIACGALTEPIDGNPHVLDEAVIAEGAYAVADAMIEARKASA